MTFSDRLATFLFERNRLLLICLVAVMVFLASGIPRIQFSGDNRAFFGTGNQEFADLKEIEQTYTTPTLLLLMLKPPEGTAFEAETLSALVAMAEDAWRMPYVLRVDLATNQMHTYAEGDEVLVEPMLDEFAEITPEAAERFRDLALASDDLRNRLLSEDGSAFGMSIRVVLPEAEPEAREAVEDYLANMRAGWQASHPDWEIRATGGLLGNNLLQRVAREDIRELVPYAFVAVVTVFILATGSVVTVFASVLAIVFTTLGTFGFAGWSGMELTAGTAIAPLAVMVLVSTSCVHITLAAIRLHEAGQSDEPFRASISKNLAPVAISHLTTGLGFLCLNFAPSPPLANMGNIVAFGLLFGLVVVFILLIAILAKRPPTRAGRLMVSGDAMRRFSDWVIRQRLMIFVLFPVLALGAVLGIRNIEYDDNVIRYFDDRYPLRQDSEAIESGLTGLEALQFSISAPDGASVFDPVFLRSVDRFAKWIDNQPEVVSVAALTNILRDLNRNMSGDGGDPDGVADTQAANAQLMMFYELSLPVGMDLNILMDVDRTQTLVTATVRAGHSEELRDLARRADAWIAENEPTLSAHASGAAIAFARISERNNEQMIWGFLTALGLVSATMIVTLRSIRHGLLSLVPNLLPALLGFGFWGWTLGDVNLGSTVVTTMTFGIVVDDTVHFLMHYLACRRRGDDVEGALADTFAVVGSAIILTSVALIMGFAILITSGFAINQHIGLLTAVVIVFALICDLLLLPALLTLSRKRG